MNEQVGWRGLVRALSKEAPHYATLLPALPRLLHERLSANPAARVEALLEELVETQRRRNAWLMGATALLAALLLAVALLPFWA